MMPGRSCTIPSEEEYGIFRPAKCSNIISLTSPFYTHGIVSVHKRIVQLCLCERRSWDPTARSARVWHTLTEYTWIYPQKTRSGQLAKKGIVQHDDYAIVLRG